MADVRLPLVRVPGKLERLAAERRERDRDTARDRGLWWDQEEADAAVDFFRRYLRHWKGEWAGQAFELAPWQATDVAEVFGWKREDGTRRYRRVWDEVARKNGKTTKAAGVSARLLVADGEQAGEVYWTATKRDQALIGYTCLAEMVRGSPDLRRFVTVPKSYRKGGTIYCERLRSKAEPLSADHNTLDGLSPSGDFRDEVHAWKDHALAGVLDTAAGARRQPLTWETTTAGVYDPESVGWQHHDYAAKVLEDVWQDDSLYVSIFAADETDDPFDPATWWRANPQLGITPKLDYIAAQAEKARRQPSMYNDFLRWHLNTWTQQVTRWLSLERWRENDGRPIALAELRGRRWWAGLDLSTSTALTGFVGVFPREDGGVDLLPRFWLPAETLEAEVRKGRRFYEEWARAGFLSVTPESRVSYAAVRAEIVKLAGDLGAPEEVAYDPWNANQIAEQLKVEDGIRMIEIRQGYRSLSEPSKALEGLIAERKIRHGGNPILQAHVAAAVIRQDANGNIAPDRDKATDRIDGVMATIMGLSRSGLGTLGASSYVEREGIMVLP